MDNPPADVGLETVTALHSFPSAVDCLQMFKIECSAGIEPLALDSNAVPSCEERSSAAVLLLFFSSEPALRMTVYCVRNR